MDGYGRPAEIESVRVSASHEHFGGYDYRAILMTVGRAAIEGSMMCPDCLQIVGCNCPARETHLLGWHNARIKTYGREEDGDRYDRYEHIQFVPDSAKNRNEAEAIFLGEENAEMLGMMLALDFPLDWDPMPGPEVVECYQRVQARIGKAMVEAFKIQLEEGVPDEAV